MFSVNVKPAKMIEHATNHFYKQLKIEKNLYGDIVRGIQAVTLEKF